ncbi:ribonuclease HII [Oscillospiraceae bacterium HV4-5-C5C]|nr:ribonuclease HII [Oscillospiraceae bacterium HV4-5-C5C]
MWEAKLEALGHHLIAGVDEAGRGPLAGPVYAAACILSPDRLITGLDDSKRLTARQREQLFWQIKQQAVAYAVAQVPVALIEKINIRQASRLAMLVAVQALKPSAAALLIDHEPLLSTGLPQFSPDHGDADSDSIAAASILAKVSRDNLLRQLDLQWPGYEFGKNKGYGTKAHIEALRQLGASPEHRPLFLRKFKLPADHTLAPGQLEGYLLADQLDHQFPQSASAQLSAEALAGIAWISQACLVSQGGSGCP